SQGKHNCHADEQCVSHELWQSLSDQIRLYLAGITLHHVVSDYERNLNNRGNSEKVIKFDAL
ncbi:MAG TPA: [Fe-S]-binding protein, partial [Methylophaga sp.]|nr:[Fe-S]-binding protein [Methylophaga sp.]